MARSKRLQVRSQALFNGWEVIDYDGQRMQKLTTKVMMPDFVRKNVQLFFKYTLLDEDVRPDIVANKYYGDPKLDWVVLYANKIIDPLFEWPMNTVTFEQFLTDKYGSIATAQATIVRYKQVDQQENITVAEYNALATVCQKYWVAQYDYLGNIKDYKYTDYNYELSEGGYTLLDASEQVYWNQVTAYDEEVTKNDENKVISLINKSYIDTFLGEYKRTLE